MEGSELLCHRFLCNKIDTFFHLHCLRSASLKQTKASLSNERGLNIQHLISPLPPSRERAPESKSTWIWFLFLQDGYK